MPLGHIDDALFLASGHRNPDHSLVMASAQEINVPAVMGEGRELHITVYWNCGPLLCLEIEDRQAWTQISEQSHDEPPVGGPAARQHAGRTGNDGHLPAS